MTHIEKPLLSSFFTFRACATYKHYEQARKELRDINYESLGLFSTNPRDYQEYLEVEPTYYWGVSGNTAIVAKRAIFHPTTILEDKVLEFINLAETSKPFIAIPAFDHHTKKCLEQQAELFYFPRS